MNNPPPNERIIPLPSEKQEPWDLARRYLSDLCEIPTSFTTPVRTLLIDQKAGPALSPASQFLVTRLLKSPTLKAIFYYITLTFHGHKVSNSAYLSSADLMRLYTPSEVAALITVIYLYRRITKIADLGADEDWQAITKALVENVEIGGHMGYAIPKVGATKGILTGGLREVMLGVLKLHKPAEFKEYYEYLLASKIPFDLNYEMRQWGCTHLDLAGNALQLIGFGIPTAHTFIMGLGASPPKDERSDAESYEFKITHEWIHALKEKTAPPDRSHPGQYYPTEMAMHKLLYEVAQINQQGSKHNWLTRTKDEINPHDTPQLYQEFLMELQGSKALEDFYHENLPLEVLDMLSEEDIQELAGITPSESG
jgi:hypothetical protein